MQEKQPYHLGFKEGFCIYFFHPRTILNCFVLNTLSSTEKTIEKCPRMHPRTHPWTKKLDTKFVFHYSKQKDLHPEKGFEGYPVHKKIFIGCQLRFFQGADLIFFF